jgi:hypothetical protein
MSWTRRAHPPIEKVGSGREPDGLCPAKFDHRPHMYESGTLGRFWCTADQDRREPGRSERRRSQK